MIIKDFDDYQVAARRTLKVLTRQENILHCIMGMAGEAGEFAETPYVENEKRIGELGDCLWYAANLTDQLGLQFGLVVGQAIHIEATAEDIRPVGGPEVMAMIHAARALDLIKKTVFYVKPLDEVLLASHLVAFVATLVTLSRKCNVLLISAANTNVKKLQARYPEKYSDEQAINRNYDVESEAAGIQIA